MTTPKAAPLTKTATIAAIAFLLFVCAGLGIGFGLLSDSLAIGLLVGMFPFLIIASAMIAELIRQLRARRDG